MLNLIKDCFKPSPPPLTTEEKLMYGGSVICSSAMSSLFVGWQIHRHQAKLTPLLRKNIQLLLPFSFGCGVALYSGRYLTSSIIEMTNPEKFKSIENRFKTEKHYQELKTLSMFDVCVLAPVIEEFVFRGAIQPILVRSIGTHPGILATSLLFGLLHAAETKTPARHEIWQDYIKVSIRPDFSVHLQACNACICGIFLGYIRHHFGLISAIGAHAGFNSSIELLRH